MVNMKKVQKVDRKEIREIGNRKGVFALQTSVFNIFGSLQKIGGSGSGQI